MSRAIYQLTERDQQNAAKKDVMRQQALANMEAHRNDKNYWTRRRTTFGLAKRDATALALQGDPEWHRGRGQGLLDQISGLPYCAERLGPAYNAGYHQGYLGNLSELRDYLAANPNFQEVGVGS